MPGDPLLEALSDAYTGSGDRGGEVSQLTLRRAVVSAFDSGTLTATITVGGVAAGDIQATYTGVPVVAGSVSVGSVVHWLQNERGRGVVLGTGTAGGGGGGSPTGAAGGVLSGSYPNPTLNATSAATALGLGALATKSTVANADVSTSAAIALSKLATVTNNRLLGNVSGSTAVPTELTAAQVTTMLGITGGSGTTFVATYAALAAISSPTRGMRVWVDEAGYEYVYYGTTTGWQLPWNQPWGLLATTTSATNTTGIGNTLSGALVTTPSISTPSNRNLLITGHVYLQWASGASGITARLFTLRNGGQLGGDRARDRLDGTTHTSSTLYLTDVVDATASGSLTYGLAAATSTGTMDTGAGTVATAITVTDVGPNGGWAPSS